MLARQARARLRLRRDGIFAGALHQRVVLWGHAALHRSSCSTTSLRSQQSEGSTQVARLVECAAGSAARGCMLVGGRRAELPVRLARRMGKVSRLRRPGGPASSTPTAVRRLALRSRGRTIVGFRRRRAASTRLLHARARADGDADFDADLLTASRPTCLYLDEVRSAPCPRRRQALAAT